MIELNITLVYQIIGFFVLLIIVARFFTTPFMRVLAEREKLMGGAKKEAEALAASVDSGTGEYEKRIKDAKAAGLEDWGKLRAAAATEEQSILEEARGEAGKYLEGVRGELEAEKNSALTSLKEGAAGLSSSIAEKVLSRKIASILVPLFFILIPTVVLASSEAHEGGGSGMGWKVFNFILLLILLYMAWKKGIRPMLEKRNKDIVHEMDEAKRMKEQALAREKEYRQKLSMLDKEVADIQQRLRKDGETEKARIIQEAREASVKIKEQARHIISQEMQKARIDIQREVSLMAVDMAEEILKKELSSEDQKRIVGDYLERLRLN